VLRVLPDRKFDTERVGKSVDEGGERSVSVSLDGVNDSVDRNFGDDGLLSIFRGVVVRGRVGSVGSGEGSGGVDEVEGSEDETGRGGGGEEVGGLEGGGDVRDREFLSGGFRDLLDDLVEGDLHPTGKVEVESRLDEVGDSEGRRGRKSQRRKRSSKEKETRLDSPSLSRLRVDTNDSLVGSSNVRGVDGKVRHIPNRLLSSELPLLVGSLDSLLDRVLMTSREGGEDELSGVRVTRVDGKSVALGDGVDDGDEVGEVDSR